MFVLIVPVALIMTQLNLRFSVRPLAVGETMLVKAYVRDAALLDGPLDLETPTGLQVETPPVRIASEREVTWRVRATDSGSHEVAVRVGDERAETTVVVGSGWGSVPQRSTATLSALLYPGGSTIPASAPVETVDVTYPALDVAAFGLNLDWLIWFFVLSLVFAFLFKGALGVEL